MVERKKKKSNSADVITILNMIQLKNLKCSDLDRAFFVINLIILKNCGGSLCQILLVISWSHCEYSLFNSFPIISNLFGHGAFFSLSLYLYDENRCCQNPL